VWLRWKEGLSDKDDWLSPEEAGDKAVELEYGTIHLSARDSSGRLGCVTTTSGLSFKIPGRVGDSPIIGAGLYLDQAAGSAGSTGRGEAVILSAGSASIVDAMRSGSSPTDACVEICRRIRAQARRDPTLVDESGTPNFNVNFYAIGTSGSFGGAALKGPFRYAACDGDGARLVDGAVA
jgi:N4-(beta-N-acetylglucosaminyl)-L-asparaginase